MLRVPDWQTDTNTSTAFNYLELKLLRCWWHIPPSHAGCIRRTQQRFAFNTNSLRCVFMSASFAVHYLLTYLVLCGLGRGGVGGFCFMHPFRWNLLVVILYFFIFDFSQMVEWLRYSACKLVPGNKRGNRKKQFSRYSSQKNTNSSRRILHTFQVHVLIWFVWPCQISFFGTRPTKHFITIICLRLSLLKKYAAFQFSRNNLKSNWKCVFIQGNPNLRYFYIM